MRPSVQAALLELLAAATRAGIVATRLGVGSDGRLARTTLEPVLVQTDGGHLNHFHGLLGVQLLA